MTANDEVLQRLDKIIAILQIAHKDEIERARNEINGDNVDAAILKVATKATPAGKLVKSVETKTKQTKRNVQRHVAELIERGLLEKSGSGTATTYKTTGLI
jgi:Fic family protein